MPLASYELHPNPRDPCRTPNPVLWWTIPRFGFLYVSLVGMSMSRITSVVWMMTTMMEMVVMMMIMII